MGARKTAANSVFQRQLQERARQGEGDKCPGFPDEWFVGIDITFDYVRDRWFSVVYVSHLLFLCYSIFITRYKFDYFIVMLLLSFGILISAPFAMANNPFASMYFASLTWAVLLGQSAWSIYYANFVVIGEMEYIDFVDMVINGMFCVAGLAILARMQCKKDHEDVIDMRRRKVQKREELRSAARLSTMDQTRSSLLEDFKEFALQHRMIESERVLVDLKTELKKIKSDRKALRKQKGKEAKAGAGGTGEEEKAEEDTNFIRSPASLRDMSPQDREISRKLTEPLPPPPPPPSPPSPTAVSSEAFSLSSSPLSFPTSASSLEPMSKLERKQTKPKAKRAVRKVKKFMRANNLELDKAQDKVMMPSITMISALITVIVICSTFTHNFMKIEDYEIYIATVSNQSEAVVELLDEVAIRLLPLIDTNRTEVIQKVEQFNTQVLPQIEQVADALEVVCPKLQSFDLRAAIPNYPNSPTPQLSDLEEMLPLLKSMCSEYQPIVTAVQSQTLTVVQKQLNTFSDVVGNFTAASERIDRLLGTTNQNRSLEELVGEGIEIVGDAHRYTLSSLSNFIWSAKISNSVAFISGLFVTALTLRQFRKTLLLLEHGYEQSIANWTPSEYGICRAPAFVGIQVSTGFFGFYVIGGIVFLIVFTLSFKPFWTEVVFDYGLMILAAKFIGTKVFHFFLVKCVGNTLLTDGHVVKRPVLWAWFSTFLLAYGLLIGLLNSVVRLVMLVAFSVASVFRLDYTIFPKRWRSLDAGWCSFYAVCKMAKIHWDPDWQNKHLPNRWGDYWTMGTPTSGTVSAEDVGRKTPTRKSMSSFVEEPELKEVEMATQ